MTKSLKAVAATATALLTVAIAASAFGQAAAPPPDPPQPAGVAPHVAKAKEIAGKDPVLLDTATKGYWCMAPAAGVTYRQVVPRTPIAPLQMFDDLWMLGSDYVSSFVLKTSAGLIMWDALNNEAEIKTIIEPGMKQIGLNMADVTVLIVTHGHADHYGGAKYIQDTYKTPIALSAADWDLMANTPPRPGGPQPPRKDQVLTDGEKITVGDATVQIILTPGHSPGTTSSILTVKDKGKPHVMAMWGGTAYPATMAALNQMRGSIQHFKQAAEAAGADGILNTHAFFYDFSGRLKARGNAAEHPLAIGADRLQKTLDIKAECLEAMSEWYVAMGRK